MRKAKFILPLTAFMLIASCGCGKPSVTESSSDPKDVSEEPAEASQEPSQETAKFTRYNKDLVFHSDILDTDLKYSVYLPEGYEQNSTERYPVVYMLHGYGDDNNSWNGDWLHAADRIKALEGGGMREMIYVFPYGYQGYYVNKYDGSFNYMDMFAEEFIPHIDASFRTLADKGHRSITGYSMGGFGAYVLAAKHPELFLCSAPLSMSFRTDRQYMTEGSGWRSQWGSLFGGKDEKGEGRLTDYYKQHCPYYVFNDANRESLETVKWYFTCGDDEEQLLIAGDSLHVVMRDRAFKHEYRVGNGGHTSTYWMTALTEVLPMFAYYMDGGQEWPGRDITAPQVPEVEFDSNGAYVSESFSKDGTIVYVAFKDADGSALIAELSRAASAKDCALLPCDLKEKSLQDWVAFYSSVYEGGKAQAFGLTAAAGEIMAMSGSFDKMYFIAPDLGEDVATEKGQKYLILNTDNGPFYLGSGALYKSCKRSGAAFEYRVIKGTGNFAEDALRCIETNKSLFTF